MEVASPLGQATYDSTAGRSTRLIGRRLRERLEGESVGSTRDSEEEGMPKYLIEASYTTQGEEGLRSKGGSDRRKAVADMVKSVGGKLESFHFGFGERDAIVIVELPDHEAAAAVALIVNSAGGAKAQTTVLLTPEQVDEAANRAVEYRPPGL
jgi:uncharacterized protein with GYD domain